ncbi:MAG: tetratricopeptide repeat protein [Bacteroidota bacterium]|nr:tetratricopeptide repeat protein [Bacteroidota bacterium]
MRLFFLLFISLIISLKVFSNNDSLLNLAQTSESDSVKILAFLHLSYSLRAESQELAFKYIDKAKKISEDSYTPGLCQTYKMYGNFYYLEGDYTKAKEFYLKAVEYCQQFNIDKETAAIYNNLGLISFNRSDYDKAIEYYIHSMKIKEEIADNAGLAYTYTNIGVTYHNLKNYEKALYYHNKAMKFATETDNKKGVSASIHNLARAYKALGREEEALTYYLKAAKSNEDLNNHADLLYHYISIGNIYTQRKDYALAMSYFDKSLNLALELNDKNGISYSYLNIGICQSAKQEYDKALKSFFKSVDIAQEVGLGHHLSDAYKDISEIYYLKKDYKRSADYMKHYMQLRDSLINEENNKQINEMQGRYENEKKEKEIELLKKDKAIQELDLETQQNNLNKQRIIIFASIGGLVLLLALSFLLFNRNQIRKRANSMLTLQNERIGNQKNIIELKNKDITDSINYAKNIQNAILSDENQLSAIFPESFVIFRPKDIVSGDFYWFTKKDNTAFVTVADCTGHGVPGAFMSMIGISLINEIVIEKGIQSTGEIINMLRKGIINAFKSDASGEKKDGMDISFCKINYLENNQVQLQYTGAYNPLWVLKKDEPEITIIKGNKQPVGNSGTGILEDFTSNDLILQKGDMFFLFSDGYADQFGGPRGKKYKYDQLKKLLISTRDSSMESQKETLENSFDNWKNYTSPEGGTQLFEQIDDVCMIGIKV